MNATAPERPEATDMDEASNGIPAAVQALIGVAQHRVWFAAGNQLPVRPVRAVGERLRDGA